MNIAETKKKIRAELKKRRQALDSGEMKTVDAAIAANFFDSRFYRDFGTILIYHSVDNEVDTLSVIRTALSDGKRVGLPICGSNGSMDFRTFDSLENLETDIYGIPSPKITTGNLIAADRDCVCIVPGLSFDRQGMRIGYGGGYYDRYLERTSVTSVGFCREAFLAECLPVDEYDRKVDAIITENGFVFLG